MKNKEQKFSSMIRENQGILHKVCRAFCHNTDYNDLFQEILIQLWRGFDSFQGKSKVSTWMYKVAFYTALNHQRYEDKRKHEPLADIHRQEDDPSDDREVIHTALKELLPEEKALIVLHLEGYNYNEIAEILGITESNVGARLSRTRKKLKEIILKI